MTQLEKLKEDLKKAVAKDDKIAISVLLTKIHNLEKQMKIKDIL